MRFVKNVVLVATLIITCINILGCMKGAVESASPVTFGFGVGTMPGWQIGDGNTSIHAVLGYSRFQFKSGGGHNNFLELGGQVRQSLSSNWWLAGEVSYVDFISKYDNSSLKPKASGFAIGPVIGYKLQWGRLPLSIYAAPEFIHHGLFSVNGMSYGATGSGIFAQLGIDFHYMSLINKKHGR